MKSIVLKLGVGLAIAAGSLFVGTNKANATPACPPFQAPRDTGDICNGTTPVYCYVPTKTTTTQLGCKDTDGDCHVDTYYTQVQEDKVCAVIERNPRTGEEEYSEKNCISISYRSGRCLEA